MLFAYPETCIAATIVEEARSTDATRPSEPVGDKGTRTVGRDGDPPSLPADLDRHARGFGRYVNGRDRSKIRASDPHGLGVWRNRDLEGVRTERDGTRCRVSARVDSAERRSEQIRDKRRRMIARDCNRILGATTLEATTSETAIAARAADRTTLAVPIRKGRADRTIRQTGSENTKSWRSSSSFRRRRDCSAHS